MDAIARASLTVLEQTRSTWTRWNLLAEVERQTRPLRLAAPADRDRVVGQVMARATAPDRSLRIVPAQLRLPDIDMVRADGTPADVWHAVERYTTRAILGGEQALLAAAREHTGLAVNHGLAGAAIRDVERCEGWTLDDGQRELAERYTTDDRRVVVGIGPAGAGKTCALRAACAVWEATGRRVVPLATSAKSAEVLATDLGHRAENLHKYLHELARSNRREADPFFALGSR